MLGIDLPVPQVRDALTRLGFRAEWNEPDLYRVDVPYWRTDVRIADDVAEEVARLIGYDTLPSAPLAGPIPAQEPQPLRETIATVRACLAGLGLCEVINYALTSEAAIARVQPLESITERPPLRTLNPLSLERTILRPTLRAGVLATYALNRRQRADAIGIFEVGRVFHARENDLPAERTFLTALYGGEVQASFPARRSPGAGLLRRQGHRRGPGRRAAAPAGLRPRQRPGLAGRPHRHAASGGGRRRRAGPRPPHRLRTLPRFRTPSSCSNSISIS